MTALSPALVQIPHAHHSVIVVLEALELPIRCVALEQATAILWKLGCSAGSSSQRAHHHSIVHELLSEIA
jgi:hypothetical protein